MKRGRFFGIGIGPGDPELLTLKALRLLRECSCIYVPKASSKAQSQARKVIEGFLNPGDEEKIKELVFPMTKDEEVLRERWGMAASCILEDLQEGKDVAFLTMGDPMLYSTYIYLLKALKEHYPDLEAEIVPGVTSITAAASASQKPLGHGLQSIIILPVPDDLQGVREALTSFPTVVLMKVAKKLSQLIHLLDEMGLLEKAVMVSHAGSGEEQVITDLRSIENPEKEGYLSIIIVSKDI